MNDGSGKRRALPCLGRITCPRCGRPDTAVMTGWRMWPHRYGAYIECEPDPSALPVCIGGRAPVGPQLVRYRAECPGIDPDAVIRLALALPAAVGDDR